MKGKKATVVLMLVFLLGLSLLLYPLVSDYWNSMHQSRVIADYVGTVSELDSRRYDALLQEAAEYNAGLIGDPDRYRPTPEETALYERTLDVSGTGVMGYLEIPVIHVSLPIYHGTEDTVLQTSIGHIQGSSLPVGGAGTHCVVSGHRGLPSAKLFTDLDQLEEGDTFLLHVLDETLVYEVDQIRIVEPQKLDLLEIERGKDFCTW